MNRTLKRRKVCPHCLRRMKMRMMMLSDHLCCHTATEREPAEEVRLLKRANTRSWSTASLIFLSISVSKTPCEKLISKERLSIGSSASLPTQTGSRENMPMLNTKILYPSKSSSRQWVGRVVDVVQKLMMCVFVFRSQGGCVGLFQRVSDQQAVGQRRPVQLWSREPVSHMIFFFILSTMSFKWTDARVPLCVLGICTQRNVWWIIILESVWTPKSLWTSTINVTSIRRNAGMQTSASDHDVLRVSSALKGLVKVTCLH